MMYVCIYIYIYIYTHFFSENIILYLQSAFLIIIFRVILCKNVFAFYIFTQYLLQWIAYSVSNFIILFVFVEGMSFKQLLLLWKKIPISWIEISLRFLFISLLLSLPLFLSLSLSPPLSLSLSLPVSFDFASSIFFFKPST